MIGAFFRVFFISLMIILLIIIGISYYFGYRSGKESVESQAIASGYGRYVKIFKDNPDGSREVEYTFYWTDKIPEGAITSKTKPSWYDKYDKKANQILEETKKKAK